MGIHLSFAFADTENTFVSSSNLVLLGRRPATNDTELDLNPDMHVSRQHARISKTNDEYWIEDLDSRHGSYINDTRLEPFKRTRVMPGDILQIGKTMIRIEFEAGDSPQIDAAPTELVSMISAQQTPTDLLLPDGDVEGVLRSARRHLNALYVMSDAMGAAPDIESLEREVVKHVARALPNAHTIGLVRSHPDGQLRLAAFTTNEATEPGWSRTQAQAAMADQQASIWTIDEGSPTESIMAHQLQTAMYAPLISDDVARGVLFASSSDVEVAFNDGDLRLLTALANQVAVFMKNQTLQSELRHQEVVRANLMKQFSPQIAEQFLNADTDLRRGGRLVESATLLITDVRGFTALSATLDPAEVMRLLNVMFGVLTPIIFEHDGTVDKYIGDAVLAVFGSPQPDAQHAGKAVRAALAMQQRMAELDIPFEIGIGIHTGRVVHGFLGSDERLEYTVIGDTVNRTSRYCDKAGRGEILLSRATYVQVRDHIETEKRLIASKHRETEGDMQAYRVLHWID